MSISIHALLAESDRFNPLKAFIVLTFLSTLSLRRATGCQYRRCRTESNFYPRSPCGERPKIPPLDSRSATFLSTLSLRRATHYDNYNLHCVDISIHALLAESDANWFDLWGWAEYFYPRSPCGERLCANNHIRIRENFYPRSPCGERQDIPELDTLANKISIHALLAESDFPQDCLVGVLGDFYPRSPCGERPAADTGVYGQKDFYPRSPCGERRSVSVAACSGVSYFYPRSPCGERLLGYDVAQPVCQFLSTLSLRRATGQR